MSPKVKPATGLQDDAEALRRHRPLLLVTLGTALVLVTYVTPIPTVPQTVADLGSGSAGRAWVLSSMSVGLAAVLLTAGALGDEWGRRRTYVAGLVVTGAGALLCGAAGGTVLFVLGRVLEGAGGAAVLACGLAVLASSFARAHERAHATAVWGAAIALGITAGALLAAALGPVGSGWRESYWVVALASLVLAPVSLRALPESSAERPRGLDLPGLVLLAAGLTALVSGLTQARSGLDPAAVVLLVLGVVLMAALALVETRVARPMLEPALFRSPGFVCSTLAAVATGLGIIATTSTIPLFVQGQLGDSVWTSTLLLVTWSASSAVTSVLARSVAVPLSGSAVLALSLVVVGVAQLLGLWAVPGASAWRLFPTMLLAGLATGVLNAYLGREAVAHVPPDRAAMGSGTNNTGRYLGAACGITVASVLITHAGWAAAVWFTAGASLVLAAAVAAVATYAARRSRPAAAPAAARPRR